jgi:enamine deaminase RidA (YjgF/YER057c/UK114 family)
MTEPPLRSSPESLPPTIGYSHLAEARGRLIFISGQVPHDAAGQLVGGDDFAAQLEQVFRNLDIAVREAGGTFADVVKLTYFCHATVDRARLPELRRVRDAYVDTARPPASSLLFVAGLARPEWLVEVEAVLALP